MGRPAQGISVYGDGQRYRAITSITRETIAESAAATEVLQRAIDQASGGEVRVECGDYRLSAPLMLARNVALRGSGRGTRLIVTAENREGIAVRGETMEGACVADLAVVAEPLGSAVAGIVLGSCGDCRIKDVLALGFARYGIWLRESSFLCEVRGCQLVDNGESNLFLDMLQEGRAGDYIPNLVTSCMIYGGGRGVECNTTVVLNIVGCAVYQTSGPAFHLHSGSNSVVLSGCHSFQISADAVVVEDSHELNLTGNAFAWHTGHGIVVRDSEWGTITGNEIIDTGSYNTGQKDRTATHDDVPADFKHRDGIRLSGVKGYHIGGNAIFNWGVAPPMAVGIREDETCLNNRIANNTVNWFKEGDVFSRGAGSTCEGNVGHRDPYRGVWEREGRPGKRALQTFDRGITRALIDGLLS
jgi:parallel beta-helix repeat protein